MSAAVRAPRIRPARVALHAFLLAMAALWIFPLFWAIYSSLRPISDTIQHGYLSWPTGGLSLVNYQTLWTQGELPYFYLNTLVIAVPAVILTLLLSSMVAFACTQFSWRFNLATLMIFTAGNLLPPQVIIVPLFRIYLSTPHFRSSPTTHCSTTSISGSCSSTSSSRPASLPLCSATT